MLQNLYFEGTSRLLNLVRLGEVFGEAQAEIQGSQVAVNLFRLPWIKAQKLRLVYCTL